MKVSLNVDSPREAGYGVHIFRALQSAMLSDPPPGVRSRTIPSVFTDEFDIAMNELPDEVRMLHPIGSPEAEAATAADDIAQDAAQAVAAGADPATALAAATEKKKRGRKSQEQKDAEARAAAVAAQNALRPGDALRGVDAKTLAQALQDMPLVHNSGGTEVRVAPDTPAEDIEAMRARLIAQETADKAKERTAVTTAAAAVDDDLASLFRKKEPESPPPVAAGTSRFAALTGPALMSEFTKYLNGDGGLFWARNVLKHHGIEVLDDLSEDKMRAALENPGQFQPT